MTTVISITPRRRGARAGATLCSTKVASRLRADFLFLRSLSFMVRSPETSSFDSWLFAESSSLTITVSLSYFAKPCFSFSIA